MAKKYKRKPLKEVRQRDKDLLYRNTLQQIREANQRLESLSRYTRTTKAVKDSKTGKFKRVEEPKYISYKAGTWSSKKLVDRLNSQTINAWDTKTNQIKIPKNVTTTQLKALQKATQQFLNSQTSTKKGIKKKEEETKKSLRRTLSDEKMNMITQEDIEDMYNMLGDNDFDYFVDKIGASTLWSLIEDSKEENDTEDDFVSRLERYINFSNDLDVVNKAKRLYDKYVM